MNEIAAATSWLRNDGYGNVFLMQVITQDLIKSKKILLRYDIDVALGLKTNDLEHGTKSSVLSPKYQVIEDFKLKAGLETLRLCLEHGSGVIMMGHIGRPEGKVVLGLSVEPIRQWLVEKGFGANLGSGKLSLLENLRFDKREEAGDLQYAQNLAAMGDVYINEAFSAYRPSTSTTVLPTLLPRAAGLHFAQEVEKLTKVRNNPKKPFVVIMGGAKVKDKLPVIQTLAKNADAVLVGGKLVAEIREKNISLPRNVLVGKLNEDGFDIAPETVESWRSLINGAKMIVWNGPLGKFEDPKYKASAEIAKLVLESGAEKVIGGGDTVSLLGGLGLLGKFEENSFVSVGGGAMLKLLSDGTLPTIEVLR